MIQCTDATNSTTADMDFEEFVTWTETEVLGLDIDDGEAPYQTFMDGWRFRFDHWHMHPWYGDQISLAPPASRPRRFEETGRSRRWTSGFK